MDFHILFAKRTIHVLMPRNPNKYICKLHSNYLTYTYNQQENKALIYQITCQWKYIYTVQQSHFTIVTYCTTLNIFKIFTNNIHSNCIHVQKQKHFIHHISGLCNTLVNRTAFEHNIYTSYVSLNSFAQNQLHYETFIQQICTSTFSLWFELNKLQILNKLECCSDIS